MSNELFAAALGVASPWYVRNVEFDAGKRLLTISIDFTKGSRFPYEAAEGLHPVHDTQTKRYRHLNFFQHECYLEVRTPRIKLPDGRVVLAEPDWAGKLSGFTLLFEALILAMCRQMPFAAVARLAGESWHRVQAICQRYVDLALARADLSNITRLAIDETSSRRGHNYLTFAADAEARKVVFVTEGRDANTIAELGQFLSEHKATPEQIASVSIDMSPAFIKGVSKHLPNARITFDKFHVIAHASAAVDKTRRLEQKTDPSLKGLRWTLLKDRQPPTLTRAELLDVIRWKMRRGEWRARNLALAESNPETAIRSATERAFAATPDPRRPLAALQELAGVGPATASAILGAYRPDLYPFLDEIVGAAIPDLGPTRFTPVYYARYAVALRGRASQLGPDWSAQSVGLALWAACGGKQGTAPLS